MEFPRENDYRTITIRQYQKIVRIVCEARMNIVRAIAFAGVLCFHVSMTYKVGLVLDSSIPDVSRAVQDVAEYTLRRLDGSGSELSLVPVYFNSSYLSSVS